ncbi:hypothetical protein BCR44DRAFT_322677 [Catenaria anguillulae PL171]|uniref:Uncharacterized protein n=1 Tax=Catenaria anguillulae PL171 TaxID=765915 RepID=A0A1Y2HPX1_9FUNG|nr:hypothetical protein BCR44DRAFT_322677 [Catenaria anguillulae PL171]
MSSMRLILLFDNQQSSKASTLYRKSTPCIHTSCAFMSRHSAPLPLDVWTLVVAHLAPTATSHRSSRPHLLIQPQQCPHNPRWRHDLTRLSWVCRDTYAAAFTVLWSELGVSFCASGAFPASPAPVDTSASAVARARHDIKWAKMDQNREQRLYQAHVDFVESRYLPPFCGQWSADSTVRKHVQGISRVPEVFPFVMREGGGLYLWSMVANEKLKSVDAIVASVASLWRQHLPQGWFDANQVRHALHVSLAFHLCS